MSYAGMYTRCVVERLAAVCPGCSEDCCLVPTEIGCYRSAKAGCYEGRECTPSLTFSEEREAAALLKSLPYSQ